MKVVAVMQARTASTRLPAKALLPVAGFPSAILSALRASNRNCEFIFATSDDHADDVLAAEARKHGLAVFRGPLQDVLARYYHAVRDLADEAIVIRLTADNVVPDGGFVEQLVRDFVSAGVEYLGINLVSQLPYGVGGEAFSVNALRKAYSRASSQFEREHVGPWMQRNCRSKIFLPDIPRTANFNHLRCTIDDQDDYQRVLRLFAGIRDPVAIGWHELVAKLASLPGEPTFRVPWRSISGSVHGEFVLGTAQLGMHYGRVNDSGQPARQQAVRIVRHAIAHGVTALDTARGYRQAESVVGEALSGAWGSRANVVTKLDLGAAKVPATEAEIHAQVDASIQSSCEALQTEKLGTVLLHRWEHHDLWGGAAWRRMCELQEEGRIGWLGASVYGPGEAIQAVQDLRVQHLQIPINVLDRRWKRAGADRAISRRKDLIVHGRSVFLQGILLHSADRWPRIAGLNREGCARQLAELSEGFGRDGIADLCLAYVRSLPWITGVVIGCETLQQLQNNLQLFLQPKLTAHQVEELENRCSQVPEVLLNPSRWSLAEESVAAYAS